MYKPNDALLLIYTGMQVGRRINAEEASLLNAGTIPWDSVTRVCKPKGAVHYFTDCGGKGRFGFARTIRDTTCRHCMLTRARQLRGLRWTHPHNADEVAYLTQTLGDKVKGFDAPQPGDDELARLLTPSV